jgi:hypothetical protein
MFHAFTRLVRPTRRSFHELILPSSPLSIVRALIRSASRTMGRNRSPVRPTGRVFSGSAGRSIFKPRRGMSTSGRSWRMKCSKTGRQMRWYSDGEHLAHLFAMFDPRVIDINEQAIIPADEAMEIAMVLGLPRPVYDKDRTPPSVDLHLTLKDDLGEWEVPVEVKKNREQFDRASNSMAIKRTWCEMRGTPLCEMAKSDCPLDVVINLRILRTAMIEPARVASHAELLDFARRFVDVARVNLTLAENLERCDFIEAPLAHARFYQCVWHRLIRVDLRQRLMLNRPLLRSDDRHMGVPIPW